MKIDIIPGIKITDKFDIPDIFSAVISSLFLNLRKNQIPPIKTINGNIVCNKEGTFRVVKTNGSKIPTFKSLKKFISSNKFIIKPKQKKIKIERIIILVNSQERYLFIKKDLIIKFILNFHI